MYDLKTCDTCISVDKLKSMLLCIPNNYQLQTNVIGNIKILNENKQYLGYIDFNSESIVVY